MQPHDETGIAPEPKGVMLTSAENCAAARALIAPPGQVTHIGIQ